MALLVVPRFLWESETGAQDPQHTLLVAVAFLADLLHPWGEGFLVYEGAVVADFDGCAFTDHTRVGTLLGLTLEHVGSREETLEVLQVPLVVSSASQIRQRHEQIRQRVVVIHSEVMGAVVSEDNLLRLAVIYINPCDGNLFPSEFFRCLPCVVACEDFVGALINDDGTVLPIGL